LEISEGLPAWRVTAITVKIGLHLKISTGSLDSSELAQKNKSN
jgi:hypothetical protein